MATYQATRKPAKPISWKRILWVAVAVVVGFNVVATIATECDTPNSSNCTYRPDSGPPWTDITFGGHYLRLYWPHFDEAVPE